MRDHPSFADDFDRKSFLEELQSASSSGAVEPPARLIIEFDKPVDIHRMRNFGEDVWRALRDERRAHIDLNEVDRATTQLVIEVPSPSGARLKWTQSLVENELKRHLYFSGFRLTWA